MDEKKQIEEMARAMCDRETTCKECPVYICRARIHAANAYKAGYRKQRTAEWVTTVETEDGVIQRYTHRCTDCNYFYKTVCPRGDDYCHKCGAKITRKEQR
jgi:hypothetical protein